MQQVLREALSIQVTHSCSLSIHAAERGNLLRPQNYSYSSVFQNALSPGDETSRSAFISCQSVGKLTHHRPDCLSRGNTLCIAAETCVMCFPGTARSVNQTLTRREASIFRPVKPFVRIKKVGKILKLMSLF